MAIGKQFTNSFRGGGSIWLLMISKSIKREREREVIRKIIHKILYRLYFLMINNKYTYIYGWYVTAFLLKQQYGAENLNIMKYSHI